MIQTLSVGSGLRSIKKVSRRARATIIPCHWRRRLTHGSDQMWLLANALAKTGLIQQPTTTLKRSKTITLPTFVHHINPAHFLTGRSVTGRRILIIDDDITSGANLRAAAVALKHGGTLEASLLTVTTAGQMLLPTSRAWV